MIIPEAKINLIFKMFKLKMTIMRMMTMKLKMLAMKIKTTIKKWI